MKKKIILFSISIIFFLILSGCVEEEINDDTSSTILETSNVEFKVTDKVTDIFDQVEVTFSEIRLFNQTEENSSYIIAISEPTTVDLVALNLSNINASLGIAEIEIGNYSKLWINVSRCKGILNSTGKEVNISVPSGWLKIQQLHLFNIDKGNHTILVDIDLENSIHSFHGGKEYKFIPVISNIEHKFGNKLRFREHNKSKIKNMVGNRKPTIDITINNTLVKNKITLEPNIDYEFNASDSIDLDGDELTFTWDFGDGTTDTSQVVYHNFTDSKKTYQLWLTVSDGTDEARYHITIKIENNPNNNQGNGNN